MIRTTILTALLASWATLSAGAESVYAIQHASLKNVSNHPVMFWCIDSNQIPSKYHDGSKYSLMKKAIPVSESGVTIITFMDKAIFLTNEDCIDDTKAAVSRMGLNPDELTFTLQ